MFGEYKYTNSWKKYKIMKNIQYYNNNAQEFYSRTINADLSDNYKAFTSYLPEQAHRLGRHFFNSASSCTANIIIHFDMPICGAASPAQFSS